MKKLESGRSMVEMLGVLAIIGVLSVGGIAGYTLSMRRHRANGVADTAAKLALVAYSACQNKVLSNSWSDVNQCDSNSGVNMTPSSAGLGALPSGVSSMTVSDIIADTGTDGGDTVKLTIGFNDDKLCSAFGSIVGAACSSNSVTLEIKQN